MTALLGPPPLEFLERGSKSREYWDENGKTNNLSVFVNDNDNLSLFLGNWRGIVPIPMGRTLDSLATSLEEGKNRDEFLELV